MKRSFPTLLMLWGSFASAEIIPQPNGGDARVLTVTYDANQVVVLRVVPDTALAVELSPAEHIENVAIGANAGWQVTPNKRGDHLFIRSSIDANPTNLIVVTDSRQYMFSLVVGDAKSGPPTFITRFTYPEYEAVTANQILLHHRYRFDGARNLRPQSMSDDGKATEIIWAHDVSIPAIYAVDADGREAIVNGAMRDGAYVVDAIAQKFIFRSGSLKTTAIRQSEKKAKQK